MSQHQKLLQKLCSTPTPVDFRWDELKTVLEHLDFEMLPNSGSRRKFWHPGTGLILDCHQPHPQPTIGRRHVRDVVERLRDGGII